MLSFRPFVALTAVILIAGCSSAPNLADEISPAAFDAPFPTLLPAETLQQQAAATTPRDGAIRVAANASEPDPIARQDARAASLKARAARLRGEVIDAAARERLNEKPTIEDDAL